MLLPPSRAVNRPWRVGKVRRVRPRWRQLPIKVGRVRLFEAGAEAKVGQFDMSPVVQQQIVGLDVAMDKTQLVDAVDGEQGLGNVKLRLFVRQHLFLDQKRHQVSRKHIRCESETVQYGHLILCLLFKK